MTRYTVQSNSAIPELATASSLEQERFQALNVFKERLKTCVKRINLSSVGSRFHAREGGNRKRPLAEFQTGPRNDLVASYVARTKYSIVKFQWKVTFCIVLYRQFSFKVSCSGCSSLEVKAAGLGAGTQLGVDAEIFEVRRSGGPGGLRGRALAGGLGDFVPVGCSKMLNNCTYLNVLL